MSEENQDPEVPEPAEDSRVQELEAQLAKAKNDYLYLMADFDNYKKRTIKERSDILKYSGERAFVELLHALDSFELALKADVNEENINDFKKGFELIHQELLSVFDKFGVKPVKSEGEPFDPMIHEALGSEESEGAKPGSIIRVLRKPYKFHDKLLRPGQVIIAAEKKSEKKE